jgi:hypothetical protein
VTPTPGFEPDRGRKSTRLSINGFVELAPFVRRQVNSGDDPAIHVGWMRSRLCLKTVSPAHPTRRRWDDRLGSVVHRRFVGAGKPGCRRGFQKSCRRHGKEPEDHALGRSQGGFGSNFHLVTDGRGVPLTVEVTAGRAHESTCVESAMDQIAIP